eukprot:scaffold273461_cov29-Tisochrysis_lutea.AAC.2
MPSLRRFDSCVFARPVSHLQVVSMDEHWALNWWFHPPDTGTFEQPYRAVSFWEAEARRRAQAIAKARGRDG